MTNNIKRISFIFLAAVVVLTGCKKTEYSFGELKAPSSVTVSTSIIGVDAENPFGNGTGKVFITATATDKISYRVDFGDGNSLVIHTDTLTYTYRTPGTNEYILAVNAIGTGGTISTSSTKLKVLVNFVIPAEIVSGLTAGTSKTWVLDKTNKGMLGMGPVGGFADIWWQLDPTNASDMAEKADAMDDEVTFSLDNIGNIWMNVDNKGKTFMNGNCVAFYGASGSTNGGYALNTGGNKKLTFMDATSATTSAISTRIQFKVPGNGIIIFGVASTNYEILKISNDILYLHCVGGIDGFSWFQRLKPKP